MGRWENNNSSHQKKHVIAQKLEDSLNTSSHAYNLVNDTEKETQVGSRRGEIILIFYIKTLSKGLLILSIPGGLSHHSNPNSLTVKPLYAVE